MVNSCALRESNPHLKLETNLWLGYLLAADTAGIMGVLFLLVPKATEANINFLWTAAVFFGIMMVFLIEWINLGGKK